MSRTSQTLTHEDVFGEHPTKADADIVRASGVVSDDVGPTVVESSGNTTEPKPDSVDAAVEPRRGSSILNWMASAFSPAASRPQSAAELTPVDAAGKRAVHAPPPTPADGVAPEGTPQKSIMGLRGVSASPVALAPGQPSSAAVLQKQPSLLQRISRSISRLAGRKSPEAAESPVERSLDMDEAASDNKPKKQSPKKSPSRDKIASPGKKSASPTKAASPKKSASPKKAASASPAKKAASPKKAASASPAKKAASPKKAASASPAKKAASPKKAASASPAKKAASPKKASPVKKTAAAKKADTKKSKATATKKPKAPKKTTKKVAKKTSKK